jgi:hypothetical protein
MLTDTDLNLSGIFSWCVFSAEQWHCFVDRNFFRFITIIPETTVAVEDTAARNLSR